MKQSNWIKLIGLTMLLMAFGTSLIAQNKTDDNQEWKLVKTKKKKKKNEGYKVYKTKIPDSKLKQFKIVGKVNCSIEEAQKNAWEMITDSTMRITKKGKSLGYVKVLERSENEMVVYDFMKGSFLVKDRDVVVRYIMLKDSLKNSTGIKWSQVDIKGYEPTDSIIRMPVATGSWSFKKIDSESCMATETFRFHPSGNPPSWLINMVVRSMIPIELKKLRERVKKR